MLCLGQKGKTHWQNARQSQWAEINRVRTFKRHWAAGIGFFAFFVPQLWEWDAQWPDVTQRPVLAPDPDHRAKRATTGWERSDGEQERETENEWGVWREWMWGKSERKADCLPLFGDVEHHDHAVTVLINIQELCIESHLGFRLHREQNNSKITKMTSCFQLNEH